MNIINRYVALYAVLFAVYTAAFRFFLSRSLIAENYFLVWIYASIYAVLVFATAWNLGSRKSTKILVLDAGLPFHATTFFVWGLVSEMWFLLGHGAPQESIGTVHLTLLIWSVFLCAHTVLFLILRKNTVKGISKSEIFE